jgi:hypothetical protein
MKVSKLDRITQPVRELADWLPMVHWGRSPFADPDEIDGTHVGNMTLHRAPDGTLYGVQDDPKNKEIKK